MPDTTANLMWISNRDLLDDSPGSNIDQSQATAIRNWEAEGRDEIMPVQVSGNYYTGGGSHFKTTY